MRLLLRRHLLDRLSSCAPEHRGPPESGPTAAPAAPPVSERVRRLQELCFLYPQAEVLARYQVPPEKNPVSGSLGLYVLILSQIRSYWTSVFKRFVFFYRKLTALLDHTTIASHKSLRSSISASSKRCEKWRILSL